MNEHRPPAHRYAAYFAPAPDSAWWEAGSRWLGRCALRRELLPQPRVPGLAPGEQLRLTAAPRRYGWHATLRAPFALTSGVDLLALRTGLRTICQDLHPFDIPPLQVVQLGNFLALVPGDGDVVADIDAVARACVIGLQPYAAPPGADELARRRADGLSLEEDALLTRWGYPYVMQRFRFHLSLTGPLRETPTSAAHALRDAAMELFGALGPCRFESVALFAQPADGADFVLLEHVQLGHGRPDAASYHSE